MKQSFVAALALVLVGSVLHLALAARHVDPLTFTDAKVIYSQSTGRTTVIANLVVPRADPTNGTNVGIAINGGTVLFILNGKGQAKSADGSASLKLGIATCGCPDGSHSAILTLNIKGTKSAQSVFAKSSASTPTTATLYFSSTGDETSYDAQFTPRK